MNKTGGKRIMKSWYVYSLNSLITSFFKLFLGVTIAGLLPGFFLLYASEQDSVSTRYGKVSADTLLVRARPGTNYEVIGRLKKDEEVEVVSEQEEWLEIIAPSDASAWCAAHLLEDDRVIGDDVNVRSGPGLVFSPFARLEEGDQVVKLGGLRDGWQRIKPPAGATAWVHADYVELIEESPEKTAYDSNIFHYLIPEIEAHFQARKILPKDFRYGLEIAPDLELTPESETSQDYQIESAPDAVVDEQSGNQDEKVDPETESKIEPKVETETIAETETGSEPEPLRVGRVRSLGERRSARASHYLVSAREEKAKPKCYLVSTSVKLYRWQGKKVRVYGEKEFYPGWRLPVIKVTGIQLLRTVDDN